MATMALSSLSRTLLSAPKQKPIPKKTNRPSSSPSLTHTPPKKVLVPIGFGSEEMEAVIIVDVLRRAGADVLLASVEKELEVEGSLGTKIVADAYVSDCADEVFDLVALPGGMPGSVRLRDCEILRTITTNQAEGKRFYGAICAAPAVALKPWGLLKKKQITCHPAFMDKLPSFRTVKSNIQVSGELTTSRGPGTTFEFALSFVEQLFGGGVAADVGGKLLMPNVGGPRKDEFNQVEWSFDHTPHCLKVYGITYLQWGMCNILSSIRFFLCNTRRRIQVIIPSANGCEETEVITLVDILRRAKVDVAVASVEKTLKIVASQQTMIIADKFIEEASDSIYDLVILPGGVKGAERLQKSKILKRLLKEQKAAGRVYGGFCSSLAILQKHGLLMDKVTKYHPKVASGIDHPESVEAGVVIDGKIITGRGSGSAIDFSLAIVNKLFGCARARSVAEGLVFEYGKS